MGRVVRTLKHGWNVFKDETREVGYSAGPASSHRSPRSSVRYFNDRSIIGSIYTRMAIDLSQIQFYHAIVDDNGVATKMFKDHLNDCITLDANVDQTSQALFQDAGMTMFETGHCAIVPTDANLDPSVSTSYDIQSMRIGTVATWYPRHVLVNLYDDRKEDDEGRPVNGGVTKQVMVEKRFTPIIENPFYQVMNEPSGTFQRLRRKLELLDGIDEAAGSGKLDLLLQLPYTTRIKNRRIEADKRQQELHRQLKDDELGIGWIDINEKVIQLNRPVDNKLLAQIEYLVAELYTQLGLTPEIMNGTASRDVINNYYDRTIEPIANAIALEMKRKFLTKTARTQGHSIEIYRDPLKLIPLSELSEVVDKLLRNAAVTANELRPKIGYMPSSDPRANELANPNMPVDDQPGTGRPPARKKEVSNEGLPGNDQAQAG